MPGMINTIDDPLLQQAKKKAEDSVLPPLRQDFKNTMAAGLSLMFSRQTFGLMEDYFKPLKTVEQVPLVVAHGVVKLMSILYNESNGAMPMQTMGPAAIVLAMHALDYVEEELQLPITRQIIDEVTKLTVQGVFTLLQQASKLSDEEFGKIMRTQHGGSNTQPRLNQGV
jgi:hypothetical protein